MFGVLMAYLVVHCRSWLEAVMRKGWPLVALAGVAMTMPAALRIEEGPRFLCIWGFTLAGVGSGLILLCAWWAEQHRMRFVAEHPRARPGVGGLLARGVAWLGVWSYSIYLWHQPFIEFLGNKSRDFIGNHIVHWNNPLSYSASVVAFVAMSIAFGAFMYYVIELPSLILRERLMRRERKRLRPIPSFTVAAVAPVQ
jgi:peptidoglycan/LPS O-acetylase OafA/YrhL